MPKSDNARFEPKEIVSGQDFAVRENKDRSTAQANETFVLDAKSNRSIGSNGETLAFGKKQFGLDDDVEQARQQALDTAQNDLADMMANPTVKAWNTAKTHNEGLDGQLRYATQAMDVANDALRKGIEDGVTGDPLADLQADAERRTAAVAQLQKDKQDAPATRQRLAQELQQTPLLQEFVRQQQKVEGARNLVGSSNSIADSSSNLYANSKAMFDPAAGGDRDLITRSVASAKVDQLLGTNVCAQEKFGLDDQGGLIGVSVQADGAGVRSQTGENEWLEQQTAFLNVDYAKPEIQKGLYDLEALDYVTGQIDRHQGNIFVDGKSGKVTGIDNDLAFPEMDREQMLQRNQGLMDKAVAGMPRMMHQETAAKILSITPEQLQETLESVKSPDTGKGLGDAEINGAVKRLQDLQAAITNAPAGGIKVVPEFTKETYDESIATQAANNQKQSLSRDPNSTKEVKFNSTSYIGSVENEREFAQAKIDAGDSLYKMRDENSAGKAKINQDFAAFKQMPPGQQAAYKDIQKNIDKLEDKLAATRQSIAKLEGKDSNLKNNLANIRHGGVEGRLSHLAKKESEITQQLRANAEDAAKLTAPIIAQNQANENALQASNQQAAQGVGPNVPPIGQRVPLNELPPPVAAQNAAPKPDNDVPPVGQVGVAGNGVSPIGQRVPLNELPPPVAAQNAAQQPEFLNHPAPQPDNNVPPVGQVGVAGNGVPPIGQRVPLNELPPPVAAQNAAQQPEFLNHPAPQPDRGAFSPAKIQDGIAEHLNPRDIEPDGVTDYKGLASEIHGNMEPDRTKRLKPDTAAIEVQLITKHEIEPLNDRIAAGEKQLADLESTPGIQPGDSQVEKQKQELNDMYDELENWETRVDTLKASMKVDDRKNRLDAINAAEKVSSAEMANKAESSSGKLHFDAKAKNNDANPRQEHELQVSAANTAKNLIGKVPDGGVDIDTLKSRIGQAYGGAYEYDGPQRLKEDGSKQRVKGANDRGISEPEKARIAAEMKPMIDQVNALQQSITPLENAQASLAADIRGDLQADPAKIGDSQTRQDFQQAQGRLEAASARVDHCEAQLKKLESPGAMDRMKARVQHGGVEQARAHYEAEKRTAVQDRSTARGDLNAALDKATQAALQQDPMGKIQGDQLGQLKADQTKLLQDFHAQKQAHADSIKPDRVQGQKNLLQAEPADPKKTVKSAMKGHAKVETNPDTLANAQQHKERVDSLKPVKPNVLDALQKKKEGQDGPGKAADNALRNSWQQAAPKAERQGGGVNIRKSSP